MNTRHIATPILETLDFVVVCGQAQRVYLLGDFNNWSPTATPLRRIERHVWQVSLCLPSGRGNPHFSYLVIDERSGARRAPFDSAYLLPGTWAAVVRTRPEAPANDFAFV